MDARILQDNLRDELQVVLSAEERRRVIEGAPQQIQIAGADAEAVVCVYALGSHPALQISARQNTLATEKEPTLRKRALVTHAVDGSIAIGIADAVLRGESRHDLFISNTSIRAAERAVDNRGSAVWKMPARGLHIILLSINQSTTET